MDKLHDILKIVNELKEINGIRMSTKMYTSLIQALGTFYMYRRNQREGVLKNPDPSLAAVTQWGANFTIKQMKEMFELTFRGFRVFRGINSFRKSDFP